MSHEIQFRTTVVEDSLNLLVQQFKEKANIEKFLTCFLEEAQELEDVLKQLYTLRWLDTAVGVQLDGLGQILALEREGLGDEDYRDALKFQALLNQSKGEPELLITALSVFTRSNYVSFFELYPAKCYGYFSNPDFAISEKLNIKMQSLCGGGIKWIGSIIGNDRPFIFDVLYPLPPDTRLFGGFAAVDADNNLIDDGTCGLLCFFS